MSPTDDTVAAALVGSVLGARIDDATEAVAVGAVRSQMSPAKVAAALVALGESIDDEDQLLELLQRAVDTARDIIAGVTDCGVTIDFADQQYTVVHTTRRTLTVDAHQYEIGEGPCLHAARTGNTVIIDSDGHRWPAFTDAARAEGVRSFLAAPLTAANLRLGSFNLYGAAPAAFDDVDAELLELLTTTVGRAIGEYARFRDAVGVADGLRTAMAHRAPIEQAKGILMALQQVDADTAFDILSKQSQSTQRKVRDIAVDFVAQTSGTAGT